MKITGGQRLNCLGDEHIRKIVEVYKNFKDVGGFSRIVSSDEVEKNDYNLNVPLYVFPEQESEENDLDNEWKELRKIEEEPVRN